MPCPGPDCSTTTPSGLCPLHSPINGNTSKKSTDKFVTYRLRKKGLLPPKGPPKSAAQRTREYRERKKALRKTAEKKFTPKKPPKTAAERTKEYRQRKKQQKALIKGKAYVVPPKTSAERSKAYRLKKKLNLLTMKRPHGEHGKVLAVPNKVLKTNYALATLEFEHRLKNNSLGYVCDICDRIWFKNDLHDVDKRSIDVLRLEFPDEDVARFRVCNSCKYSVCRTKIPIFSRSNGFAYPKYPKHLPALDRLSGRFICPQLPFLQIRHLTLKYEQENTSIIGEVVNVPIDDNNMVSQLPRGFDDDCAINIHAGRRLILKSSYLQGHLRKFVINQWLELLSNSPLYKRFKITVDQSFFEVDHKYEVGAIEDFSESDNVDSDLVSAQQQTLMLNIDKYMTLDPDPDKNLKRTSFDEFAEELSFPAIYLGHPRVFKDHVKATPFMMVSSEIRRKDRRGVTPEHILYMALKILRHRLTCGSLSSLKLHGDTPNITGEHLVEKCVEDKLSFLKSIPNSVAYWQDRKKDLFAMIRTLGKPSFFLSFRASEHRWPDLLKILYKLKHDGREYEDDPLEKMSSYERATLVNEDPVVCALYFDKLVDVILHVLKSKTCCPFGQYRVIEFFKCIEFQNCGSPHAHIFLWLDKDPNDYIGSNIEQSLLLIDELCSVDANLLQDPKTQTHNHTFTCYTNNDEMCRFGAPFWPMSSTRILRPMPKDDGRRDCYRQKFEAMKQDLQETAYENLDEFLQAHNVKGEGHYLSIISSGIARPMVLLKRNIDQIWINNFNPWIASVLQSNMDIQFIPEERSCALYLTEYMRGTNRGISRFHRDLNELCERNSEQDHTRPLKDEILKMVNNVEMGCPEAAWYLLRLKMSDASRKVVYIPTTWPHERQKTLKPRKFTDEEEPSDESDDLWKEDNIIQTYERRPQDTLEKVTLAQFVANYYKTKSGTYSIRNYAQVIRFRQYEIEDVTNYKREMVTLHYPFFNEVADILDRNKFLRIYDDHYNEILWRKQEFEFGIQVEKAVEACCAELNVTNEGNS